jgi:Protein of unknown function (DUF2845)
MERGLGRLTLMRTRLLLAGLFVFIWGISSSAFADAMPCGDRFAATGDSLGDVAGKCGPPTAQDHRDEVRSAGESTTTVAVDTWTYDLGRGNFVRTLTFVNGTLKRIEKGDYGK